MDSLYALGAIALGLIIGSFLNALSFRYHTGIGMGGRSRCMRCGTTLKALDLVPVFSYLALRGRCRYCKVRISSQYPLIEAVAGLLSYAMWTLHPQPVIFGVLTVIWATSLFLVVYDMRHTMLPVGALALLCVMGISSTFVSHVSPYALIGLDLWALSAGLLIGGPLLLVSLFSRGRWMGWGDGILAAAFGWMLGFSQGFAMLIVAFWSGAITGLALIAYTRWRGGVKAGYTMHSAIPFAPFLALGAFVAHVFHLSILSISF